MYISQITADRIRKIREEKGISATELNRICDLSKNTISVSANSKNGLSAKILFDIAKFLDCSVDYLLGRTDNPNINDNSIKTGDVKGINVKGDTSVTISETPKEHDTIKQNFIALFDNLSPENQIEVMYFTKQLMEKES